MKSFTKITETVYTPLWINIHFITYSKQYEEYRRRIGGNGEDCVKCNHHFYYGEEISLAYFKNVGNETLCVKCAEELNE